LLILFFAAAAAAGDSLQLFERVGAEAGFEWKVHPHMLWHGCGCKLVNDARDTRTIRDYLGYRSIQSDGTLYGSRERAICWVVAGLI